MKNLIPAILSTVISFAATTFALNNYVTIDAKGTGKPVFAKKKKGTTKKDNNVKEIAKASKSVTNIDTENIQGSFENWDAYTKQNIDLMSTFNALNEKGEKVKKKTFLSFLRTGAFIPVKTTVKGEDYYQLTLIDKDTDRKIKKSIVSNAKIAYGYFKMEGKKLPEYDFVDLKGKSYNKADTKGKVLVLKCWFITCKVCVEEFPELNKLVDTYKNENIEFVSLAFDEKDKLIAFLKTKDFKFPTIPLQKDYMSKKLKVKQYPTHLIVDTNGRIVKMVNSVKTLTSELESFMSK